VFYSKEAATRRERRRRREKQAATRGRPGAGKDFELKKFV